MSDLGCSRIQWVPIWSQPAGPDCGLRNDEFLWVDRRAVERNSELWEWSRLAWDRGKGFQTPGVLHVCYSTCKKMKKDLECRAFGELYTCFAHRTLWEGPVRHLLERSEKKGLRNVFMKNPATGNLNTANRTTCHYMLLRGGLPTPGYPET